jgi:hypothetical protein
VGGVGFSSLEPSPALSLTPPPPHPEKKLAKEKRTIRIKNLYNIKYPK